jgi:hypothetical protein
MAAIVAIEANYFNFKATPEQREAASRYLEERRQHQERKKQERRERDVRWAEKRRQRMLWLDERIRESKRRKELKSQGKERNPQGKSWWKRKWDLVKFLVC